MRLAQLFELFGNKLTIEPPLMTPATIALIISLVEEAVKITPGIVADLQELFSDPNPTPAKWEALRQKVKSKSYADYVPASALPGAIAPANAGGGATPPAS